VDGQILVGGILILLSIASSKFSARLGVPVLVLFLALGMLAGSEGFGGIEFEDYHLSYALGTVALAVILFDGGLRTPVESIRIAWCPALLLATVGVFVTAIVTGLAASSFLGLSLLEGLLLGSIVGSTDASAVFALLRSGGVRLPPRLAATLEVESASNDPMAIFLTVGLVEVLANRVGFGVGLAWLLVTQMTVGAIAGLAAGYGAVWLVNRINLEAAGLYPILISACGLLAFGVAATLSGSGFLAIYLAGVVIGNRRVVFRRAVFLFHDAAAWLAQIVMFVVLGLLSFPSRLLAVTGQGLLVAVVLMLLARPAAVVLTMLPFRFDRRELTLLSWAGLKGAVPITLATFPLMAGLPHAELLFNVVFFVVLVSTIVQGWSLAPLARWLGLQAPPEPPPPVTLEISSLGHVEADIVDYTVGADSRAAGRLVRELALPDGAVIALVSRDGAIIPPQGDMRVRAGDHVTLVIHQGVRPMVDRVFSRGEASREDLPTHSEFPLRGSVMVGELEELYGVKMDVPADRTLDQLVRNRLGHARTAALGDRVVFGLIALHVRSVSENGRIDRVGMVILPSPESENS
jgi:cell volume regulation protein A